MAQHSAMMKMSPTSMKVTFKQLREGKHLSFDEEMKVELRIVSQIIMGHDFYEGVRAILLDKDYAPKWQPDTLEGVSEAAVNAHFDEIGEHELEFAPDHRRAE